MKANKSYIQKKEKSAKRRIVKKIILFCMTEVFRLLHFKLI